MRRRHDTGLPFDLPERDPVTRIRGVPLVVLRGRGRPRTQAMTGYDPRYTDIVDYIVEITEEIWTDGEVGRIAATYSADCPVMRADLVMRGADEVIAATRAAIDARIEGASDHLSIAWSGDSADFSTSHLGLATSVSRGPAPYGGTEGARVTAMFCADCISRDNRIHTEWLARDNGAVARCVGVDPHAAARAVAAGPPPEAWWAGVLAAPGSRGEYEGPRDTPAGYGAHHLHDLWTRGDVDHAPFHYAPEVRLHWAGQREAVGLGGVAALTGGLRASLAGLWVQLEHASWAEETDGTILALRWIAQGTAAPGGLLGDIPAGARIVIPGMSHLRFGPGTDRIVEEWTVFDEIAALAMAYRQ